MTAESHETLVEVQLALAQVHLDRQEYESALDLLRAAARAKDARAINMLGRAYERGWGVPPDCSTAAAYYREAADLGDVWARFNLADLFLRGDGVERDEAAAYALYADAARQGHAKSLNMLGLLHEDGRTVAPDENIALEFYRAGAAQGDCWAHLNAARILVAKGNYGDAFVLLERSVSFGFPDFWQQLQAALSCFKGARADELKARLDMLLAEKVLR